MPHRGFRADPWHGLQRRGPDPERELAPGWSYYLYRNCGEGGNIRHQTPHGNRIIHNVFNFGQAAGAAPAVWLSARNGQRSYCDQDRGYPFGSSASDLDHATGNLIEDNRFIGTDPERAIRDTSGPVGTL